MMTVFVIVVLIILVVIDRWKSKRYIEIHKELGNDTIYLPIIGHAYNFMGSNEDRMNTLIRASWQACGRKHGAASMWMGHKLMILITDPIQAGIVLKTTHDKDFIHQMMKHLLGNGTVFTTPDHWHRRRKILAPSFSTRYLSKFICVFEANSKVIVDKLEAKVGGGNFSCFDYFSPYALDSLCETALGVNINIQNQSDHKFFMAFKNYFSNVATRVCQPWLRIDALYKFLPVGKRQETNKKIMYDFIDDLIYKKKALIHGDKKVEEIDNVKTGRANIKTFLELMIETSEQTDKGYTHEELREEILTLALAGTDTSAAGACFTLVMLSQHPDVQEKVYQEILSVFEDPNKPIEMADLQKLKYMDAVIKETLRLYPPVPIVSRRATSDVQLPSGLVIPKGVELVVHVWGINRNPYYWGTDANEFKPERFLLKPFPVISSAYLPFSTGPRNCIGYQYALFSLKITIATLLRKYRLLPATSFKYDKTNPLRVSFEIMLKHVNDYEVRIEYRNKNHIKHVFNNYKNNMNE